MADQAPQPIRLYQLVERLQSHPLYNITSGGRCSNRLVKLVQRCVIAGSYSPSRGKKSSTATADAIEVTEAIVHAAFAIK